jgi:hypothetical protein
MCDPGEKISQTLKREVKVIRFQHNDIFNLINN